MDLILFIIFFLGAVVICLAASAAAKPATRACASCGGQTPIQARRCRHCGYSGGRV
jgi:ribosomal protein L40E